MNIKQIAYSLSALLLLFSAILVGFDGVSTTFAAIEMPTFGSGGGSSATGTSNDVLIGGRIKQTIPCICNDNPMDLFLKVEGPKGGKFMKVMESRMYRMYSPYPQNWILGKAKNEDADCEVGLPPYYCFKYDSGKKIKYFGTSSGG